MRPDAKRKLDRLIWERRLKMQVLPAAILVVIVAAYGIWEMDEWKPDRVLAGSITRPPGNSKHDTANFSLTAALETGKTVRVESDIRILAPKGTRITVQQEVSRILHRKRYRLIRVESATDK